MMTEDKAMILAVDDSSTNLDILVEILSSDYQVCVAMNGPGALETAEKDLPDLILLDIMMPGMDGYEVCRQLKSNPLTSGIPVIFITAKSEIEDEALGFEAGCVDYLTKPINPLIVRARVRSHIDLTRAKKELEIKNQELVRAAKLKEEVDSITRHDLKNPLTGILAGADYLAIYASLAEDEKESVDIIRSSALKMLEMINRSLDIFKMEQGTYCLRPENIDLAGVLEKINKEMAHLMKIKHVGIDVRVPKEADGTSKAPFWVRGEELLCYSMLANLIKNAIEASPDNETVQVSLSLSGDRVVLEIHNQGAVPEEIRENFFNKYVTCGKPYGTGLGTYSARLIAHTLGGDIMMRSDTTTGTTVSVSLQSIRPCSIEAE